MLCLCSCDYVYPLFFLFGVVRCSGLLGDHRMCVPLICSFARRWQHHTLMTPMHARHVPPLWRINFHQFFGRPPCVLGVLGGVGEIDTILCVCERRKYIRRRCRCCWLLTILYVYIYAIHFLILSFTADRLQTAIQPVNA